LNLEPWLCASAGPARTEVSRDGGGGGGGGGGGDEAAGGEGGAAPSRTRGLGRIFLEFSCADTAVVAALALGGRFFAGRILAISFADAGAFSSGAAVCLTTAPPQGAGAGAEVGSVVIEGPPRSAPPPRATASPALAIGDAPPPAASAPPAPGAGDGAEARAPQLGGDID
jgi:hypothetical protein